MEAAAFHCALLKIILMMQRRTFAPTSKNFVVPNPEIPFESGTVQVQTACEAFPERPVVVGINSFGFGGANGHCVIREYQPSHPRVWSSDLSPEGGRMIPLSARTNEALTRSAQQLREMLAESEVDLYTIAGNLSRVEHILQREKLLQYMIVASYYPLWMISLIMNPAEQPPRRDSDESQ